MQAAGGAALIVEDLEGQSGRPITGDDRPPGSGRRALLVLALVVPIILAIDVVSKMIAVATLSNGDDEVVLAGGLLTLNLVYNSGAAFGIGAGYTVVLSLLATGVVVFVLVMARRLRSLGWAVAFGLLLGGALGNLTDRFFREPGFLRGHVVDFLELPLFPPVFNLADTSITCAAVLIVWHSLRGRHLDGTVDARPGGSARATSPPDLAAPADLAARPEKSATPDLAGGSGPADGEKGGADSTTAGESETTQQAGDPAKGPA